MAKKDPIIHAEAEVRALQKILGVPETGAFDAATNTALFKKTVEFQATFNQGKEPKDRLKVDGWMGPKTLEALKTSNPEAYGALKNLGDKVSKQRGAGLDGKSVFGLGTLQSRIEGESGHPPKGQELNAGQVKAITGRDLAVTQAESEARHPDVPYYGGRYALGSPQVASTTGAINENGLSDAEKAALGGAAVAGFTAAAWKGSGAKSASVSPGTGLAVKEQRMPRGSATVGVEKDVTPRGSAETSGPNRPGRVAGGAAAETAGTEVTAAARGGAATTETAGRTLATTEQSTAKGLRLLEETEGALGKAGHFAKLGKAGGPLTAAFVAAAVAGPDLYYGDWEGAGRNIGDLIPGVSVFTAQTEIERNDAAIVAGTTATGAGIGFLAGGIGAGPGALGGGLVGETATFLRTHSLEEIEKSQRDLLPLLAGCDELARAHKTGGENMSMIDLYRDPDIRNNIIGIFESAREESHAPRSEGMLGLRRAIGVLEKFGELEAERQEAIVREKPSPEVEKERAIVAEIQDKVPDFTIQVAMASGTICPITRKEAEIAAADLLQDREIRARVREHYEGREGGSASYALAGLKQFEITETRRIETKNADNPFAQMAEQPVPVF